MSNRITNAETTSVSPAFAKQLLADVPVRIQRSRQHKQKSPNGLSIVYVGRPGKWGNPFKAVGDMVYEYAGDRHKILDPWVWKETCTSPEEALFRCLQLYQDWLLPYKHGDDLHSFYLSTARIEEIRLELQGKNLSCWCAVGQPCHADILLKLANG